MTIQRVLAVAAGLAAAYVVGLAAAGLLSHPRPSDVAIVLGNELNADGTPSPRLQARLDAALAAYRAGLAPKILVSGGIEQPGNRAEAAAMAEYLADHGVPRSAIIEDPNGTDTFETARAAAGLLPSTQRLLVVTQWFHVPRTVWTLRRFGFRKVSASWPRFVEWRDAYSLLREAMALPAYIVRYLGKGVPVRPGTAQPPP